MKWRGDDVGGVKTFHELGAIILTDKFNNFKIIASTVATC